MPPRAGIAFSALAGLLGALASVFGKAGLGPALVAMVPAEWPWWTAAAVRASCGALAIACNAAMVWAQARGLEGVRASVGAVATASCANFFFSAVLGAACFGEPLPLVWWAGATLILLGLFLIHHAAETENPSSSSSGASDTKKSR